MHGALLMQQMRLDIRKAASSRERGKDMRMRVDDAEFQNRFLTH
jgi:hypothetical protein